MQEIPQNITGTFATDEKNFVNLLSKMLTGTLEPLIETMEETSKDIALDLNDVYTEMFYPMSESDKEKNALNIQKVILNYKSIGDELLKSGRQFNDLMGMLGQYAQALLAKPKPTETPVEIVEEKSPSIENPPETC
jgi:hypothetical protein